METTIRVVKFWNGAAVSCLRWRWKTRQRFPFPDEESAKRVKLRPYVPGGCFDGELECSAIMCRSTRALSVQSVTVVPSSLCNAFDSEFRPRAE
jgi:hypothetical protein